MKERFLLDTNVLIWATSASDRISSRARRALERHKTSLVVSAVSVWELVFKYAAGKLVLATDLNEVLDVILYRLPWKILPLIPEHVVVLSELPMRHKDPFDRMLVAQAQYERLVIVTSDETIPKYAVKTLW